MIKRLARCIREYKWPAILSPVCMIGEVAMEVTIPLVMADLYDFGVRASNLNIIATRSVQLVICAIMSLLFGVASATFAAKAATGFSVTEYIIHCRIQYARTLLSRGCSVQQAGENAGFGDNAHFIRTFRRITGMTPGQFARSSRENLQ